MSGLFRKASKEQARLRMALVGPSGGGKTFSALAIAQGLGGRVALIDTEHGSASKYADLFDFDTLGLAVFHPGNYIEAIKAAEKEGYRVLVIDSLSHAWAGQGGVLEQVDAAAKRSQSKNSFTAWRDVTPLHNALVDAILQSGCHVIATMRAKTEYVLEPDERGKLVPVKKGLAPIQRDGMDYEFDVVADMTLQHDLMVGKTRWNAIDQKVIRNPGREFGEALAGWLSDGKAKVAEANRPAPHQAAQRQTGGQESSLPAVLASPEQVKQLLFLKKRLAVPEPDWINGLSRRGVSDVTSLRAEDAAQIIERLEQKLAALPESDRYPFEVAAKPEDVAAHQEAVASTTAAAESKATEKATEAAQAQVGDSNGEPTAGTPEAADDFQVPDQTRPAKADKKPRGKKGTNGKEESKEETQPTEMEAAATTA
jgi:hypothetical protein